MNGYDTLWHRDGLGGGRRINSIFPCHAFCVVVPAVLTRAMDDFWRFAR